MKNLLQMYERSLEECFIGKNIIVDTGETLQKFKKYDRILKPEEINQFLQDTREYGVQRFPYYAITDIVVSSLIQKSYKAGYNHFPLDTRTLPVKPGLGSFLRGKKKRPIVLNISGDVGVGSAGEAQHAILNIEGNVGAAFGFYAKYVEASIKGDIEEENGIGIGGRKLTFKTSNPRTLKKLEEHVPEMLDEDFVPTRTGGFGLCLRIRLLKQSPATGNRIVFVNPNGTERIVKEY